MSGRCRARKRRSVPIEFPQSGDRPRLADVGADEVERCAARLLDGHRRRLDGGEQAALRVHLPDDALHAGELVGGGGGDDVGSLGEDRQAVVGDERRDLEDDVTVGIEPGHLEIHPHEHER